MTGRKKEAGNVGEILTIGLCILALTALMISYMENVQLIAKKAGSGSAGTMLSAQDGNGRLSGGSGSDAADRRTGESGDDRD